MKKILSVVLVLAMLFGSTMVCNAGNPDDYTDITGHWASIALESAVTNNILTGYNHKISPNSIITRAEMATIIVKAFGAEERADISQYTDVPSSKWYADYMSRAVKMGIMGGEGDKLRPEDPVTREEAFSMLAKAFELSSQDLSPLDQFKDKDQVDENLRSEIAAMISAGYVSGGGGILTPKATLLRGQIAQVIYLMAKTYVKLPGTYETIDPGSVIIRVPDVTLKNLTVKGCWRQKQHNRL